MVTRWATCGCSTRLTMRLEVTTYRLAVRLKIVVVNIGITMSLWRLWSATFVVILVRLATVVATTYEVWRRWWTRSLTRVEYTHRWHINIHMYVLWLCIHHCICIVCHCSAE